jgi:hypothetical protein
MRELVGLLVIIAVIAIIWYLRKQNAQAAEQRKIDEFRQMQAKVAEADRASLARTASAPSADQAASSASVAARGTGMLQEAADQAAGLRYETATGEMEAVTADLEAARRQADRDAERLARRADEALAAVQAAAAAHGGAVPGDGTRDCPADFPIKGNMPSRRFHMPGQPSYERTIPEVCFQSAAAAEAAGFSESGDEAGMRRGRAATRAAGTDGDDLEAVVVEAIEIREREDARRGDVVAEAIAAADAGSVPPGAIRGDGSRECPPAYPVKASQTARQYHAPGVSGFETMVAELCFSSVEAAEAAGFAAIR